MSDQLSTVTGGLDRLEVDSTMTGISSTILPEGMTEDAAVQVYNNYNFQHQYDENMTITKYREEVSLGVQMLWCCLLRVLLWG